MISHGVTLFVRALAHCRSIRLDAGASSNATAPITGIAIEVVGAANPADARVLRPWLIDEFIWSMWRKQVAGTLAVKRELKHSLAYAVMVAAADMLDDWPATIRRHPELSEIDPDEAAKVVARWLDKLPGRDWDDRLPEGHWP